MLSSCTSGGMERLQHEKILVKGIFQLLSVHCPLLIAASLSFTGYLTQNQYVILFTTYTST